MVVLFLEELEVAMATYTPKIYNQVNTLKELKKC